MSPSISIYSHLHSTIVITLLLALCCNVSGFYVVDDSQDLILSFSEKQALDKFKSQVMHILPEDFMKSDFYLVRWIRINDLDIEKAQNSLMQNLKWRQRNNISKIIHEDWSDLTQEFRYSRGGRDKEGRPFGTLDLGEWDLLGAALSGRRPRVQRYLTFLLELALQELLQAQRESTKSITRGTIIVDGEGGSIRSICPACIATFFQWIRELELYYPRFLREIIVINAPSVTEMALRALRPAMSKETSDIIHVFTMNKKMWMSYLDKNIDKSQRTPKYGGTKRDQIF